MGISSYSTTPASNTSINGISVAEGCSPGNLNDAIRQLMADIVSGVPDSLQLKTGSTVSAVNYITGTGSLTTVAPTITVGGSDTNISLNFGTKGTGTLTFYTNTTYPQFQILNGGTASNNYITVAGTGGDVQFGIAGSGTANANLAYWSKGTGGHIFYNGTTYLLGVAASGSDTALTANTGYKLKVSSPAYSTPVALTDGATITPDFSTGNDFSVTLGGNRTLANPTNITVGQKGVFVITQDGTGSRTLAYGTYYKWSGGTAPTLTTTASAVDRIQYHVVDATHIHCTWMGAFA